MARLYLTDAKSKPLVVSVEEAVGPRCPNKRLDVLLVQFMLRAIHQVPGRNLWIKTRRGTALEIDGMFGRETEAYIELFQRQFPKYTIAHDSRVHPFSGGSWYGARTGVFMTMAAINWAYMEALGNDAIATIIRHPLFPSEIRPSIQISL